MSLIEELLKYSNKHSRVIILILLGIIISGSIAGGLWIQNLNSMISEKDKILEQRIKLAEKETSLASSAQILSQRELNLDIMTILSKYELSMQSSANELKDLAKEFEGIARSSKTTPQIRAQLLSYSKSLTDKSASISKEVGLIRSSIQDQVNPSPAAQAAEAPDGMSISWVLLLLLSLLILCIAFAIGHYINRRLKQREKDDS